MKLYEHMNGGGHIRGLGYEHISGGGLAVCGLLYRGGKAVVCQFGRWWNGGAAKMAVQGCQKGRLT